MGYSKRRANSKSKLLLSDFIQLKTQFLLDLKACIEFKEIPHKLIINWDQTGLKIGPTTSWTMEKKGAKRVELVALDDKQQITAVFGCTLKGDFLPLQVIYRGKTTACLPKFKFPDDWHATFTANHWANERTINDYINCIIILYEGKMQAALKLAPDYPALVLYDVFKGQSTKSVASLLQKSNILFFKVPANCTDRLQALDVSVNKPAKKFLRRKFQEWYAEKISTHLEQNIQDTVDLRLSIMKPIGQCCHILVTENLNINYFRTLKSPKCG